MPNQTSPPWPSLDYAAWRETRDTLHLWTQVVGKIRLRLTPWLNHSWHVPLYVTSRGLTTSPIAHGSESFEIEFDFLEQVLDITLSDGRMRRLGLRPQSVADFYAAVMAALAELGISVAINDIPCEIAGATAFSQDRIHSAYDADYALRFWEVLLRTDRIFKTFRTGFIGKSSPVHFFWGSFDLAVTRFSGKRAPERPGADAITREAYSDEVISAGFWPGNGGYGEAAFYCYAAPSPAELPNSKVEPAAAYFDTKMGEFLLRYNDARKQPSPEKTIRAFLESTYAEAADKAGWDRAALERR